MCALGTGLPTCSLPISSVLYVFGLGSFFRGMQPGAGTGDLCVHVALGARIFRTLMSSVIGSANVFHGSVSFIMDGHMRLTDDLLQSLAKSFFDMCMYLPVVAITLAFFGDVSLYGLLLDRTSTRLNSSH